MCHGCLLGLIALSLVLPEYMPPQCCDNYFGILNAGGRSFKRLAVDAPVRMAWRRTRRLQRDGLKCPDGHVIQSYDLQTNDKRPIWREYFCCETCEYEKCIRSPSNSKKTARRFCLFCQRHIKSTYCRRCNYYEVAFKFIDGLQGEGKKQMGTGIAILDATTSYGDLLTQRHRKPSSEQFAFRRGRSSLGQTSRTRRDGSGSAGDAWSVRASPGVSSQGDQVED